MYNDSSWFLCVLKFLNNAEHRAVSLWLLSLLDNILKDNN